MSNEGVADADDASPIDSPATAVLSVATIVSLRRGTAYTFYSAESVENDDPAKEVVASGFCEKRRRSAATEPAAHGEYGGDEGRGCDTVEPEVVRRRDDRVHGEDRMREDQPPPTAGACGDDGHRDDDRPAHVDRRHRRQLSDQSVAQMLVRRLVIERSGV